jgi:arsenical pump membrane protein
MHSLLYAIVAISILLMLIRPRAIPEVYWIGAGVLFLLIFGLISFPLAGHAIAQGNDVYLFLTGMMLLAELAREHGVFDWLAVAAVRSARGSTARLFTLVYLAGTLVTIFMSNDATAVVLTPAILTATRKASRDPGFQPLPYLFVCALIANAASFVLPLSNPANLVVFHDHMPTLAQWMISYSVPSALSILVTYAAMRWIFRYDLRQAITEPVAAMPLNLQGRLVLAGIAAMVLVLLTASAKDWNLGLPTCLAALVITALVSITARTNPWPLVKEISWTTLILVAGLFVMVNAVENIGALHFTQQWLSAAQSLPPALGTLLTGFTIGIANNLVNNLPLGLIAGATLHSAHTHGLLTDAVMIGIDLGPNLSITGSLATILWLLALRKDKIHVTFWQFLRVGLFVMPVALLAALVGAILTHATFRTS